MKRVTGKSKVKADGRRIKAMREGGQRLRRIKRALQAFVSPGVTFEAIESEAQRLIWQAGAQPNFALVPGYHWATCLMRNDELCHGIPQGKTVLDGDLLTIDVGLLFDGFNLDTTISFGVGAVSPKIKHFLAVGEQALAMAIQAAQLGARVYEVSLALQEGVESKGFGAVYQLTGHGVGEKLHMEPSIPCVADLADKREKLTEGQTVAIEIMYAMGNPALKLDADGWTYRTVDGSLSGMFEETVLVTTKGPEILT